MVGWVIASLYLYISSYTGSGVKLLRWTAELGADLIKTTTLLSNYYSYSSDLTWSPSGDSLPSDGSSTSEPLLPLLQ